MSRLSLTAKAVGLIGLAASQPAIAEVQGWAYCWVRADTRFHAPFDGAALTAIFPATVTDRKATICDDEISRGLNCDIMPPTPLLEYAQAKGFPNGAGSWCWWSREKEQLIEDRAMTEQNMVVRNVKYDHWDMSDLSAAIADEEKEAAPSKPIESSAQAGGEIKNKEEEDQKEQAPIKTRAEYEAEWQAELDKYAADKAAWEAKVAAQKAEEERQKAAHAAAQEEAERARAAHEAKMEAHRRRENEYARLRAENAALLARHAACVGGDSQACADIEAGKPINEQLTSNEDPKTSDDDARTCVSPPVVSASDTFKGQTAAVVFNGCKTAVDVRVCLLRSGGWNCGVTWGLQPQQRWTHTSFETQGEIFWDARMAGSNEPLGSPGGN